MFYSTFLSVKCCCHDISEDNLHTLVQRCRRHLFIGTQTGLNDNKAACINGPKYHGCRRIRLNICCNHGCDVAHGAQ